MGIFDRFVTEGKRQVRGFGLASERIGDVPYQTKKKQAPGVPRFPTREEKISAASDILDNGSSLSKVNKNVVAIENRIRQAEQRREEMQPHKRQINPIYLK
jgi:hypothetical protein